MKTLYTTEATAHGGRNGHVRSSDGILDLDLQVPEQMGGHGGATNPEQLFAAGYAACFEGTLREVARTRKLPVADARITARVTLNITDDKRYLLGPRAPRQHRGRLGRRGSRAHACGASDLPLLQLNARERGCPAPARN